MNHPSEWAKFFDERSGRYRYKHKGSGVVRDTLMAIGKTLKKGVTKAAKKVVQSSAEKAGKKLSEAVVEKGLIKYNEYFKKGGPKHLPRKHRRVSPKHELPAKHRPRKPRREMQ